MRAQYLAAQLLHILLVLSLCYLLFRGLYHGFTLLKDDFRQTNAAKQRSGDAYLAIAIEDDRPTPQQIVSWSLITAELADTKLIPKQAASLNTVWLSYDPDHCRNVCEASKVACQLRDCRRVPGVRSWD